MQLTVTLPSDGEPIVLRRLALFETEGKRPELLGSYQYEVVTVDGYHHKEIYDLTAVKSPPERPVLEPGEELLPHTNRWWQFVDWQRFGAAVSHEVKRQQSAFTLIRWYLKYILDKCVQEADHQRIQTKEDWAKVVDTVLIPRISQKDLADCFIEELKADYKGMEVFQALEYLAEEESGSVYDVIMTWEIQVINRSSLTFDEWLNLPYPERVQRVAGEKLPVLMDAIAISDKTRKR